MADRAWVASRKGLIELRRRAGGWSVARTSFLGDPVSMVLPPDASGRMVAALNLGHFGVKLHASDDAGATWREVAAPAFGPQPEGAAGPAWKVVMVWAMERQGDAMYAGTLPGALFKSTDGAQSWQLDEVLWNLPGRPAWCGGGYDTPGIHSICPLGDDTVLVGVSCAGAWVTRDGGTRWAQTAHGMRAEYMPPEQAFDPDVQDPHAIARCAAQPDVLWCQHHNGIFRSTDGAAHWTEIEKAGPSTFGFAVAPHPRDPLTAWFVPGTKDVARVAPEGKVVVTRTRDGGKSFDVLSEGLPQSHAYDLVYRHALAVDGSGERLMFGSTTGNLFASDDGGQRWATVSHHLPPVLCVRYA